MTTYYLVDDLDFCIHETEGKVVLEGPYLIIQVEPDYSIHVSGPLFTDKVLAECYLRELVWSKLAKARQDANDELVKRMLSVERIKRLTALKKKWEGQDD